MGSSPSEAIWWIQNREGGLTWQGRRVENTVKLLQVSRLNLEGAAARYGMYEVLQIQVGERRVVPTADVAVMGLEAPEEDTSATSHLLRDGESCARHEATVGGDV